MGFSSGRLGATSLENHRCEFRVWAPAASKIELRLVAPDERTIAMEAAGRGYYRAVVESLEAGARYFYRLDGARDRPDPASRLQPEGVHGPSEVTCADFAWNDAGWKGMPLEDFVMYELHVGTFTPEGTFDAVVPHLDELKELGVTAIELMPVAEFPGRRNWGYDGVYPFAVETSYGGPEGLKRLVDACHARGLAAILDVVYNHLGPEGNYLREFGPYFTDRYRTPWGSAVNLDGPGSDEVRRYFLENAAFWIEEFHFDGLRLDAVHAIYDHSANPFLRQLAEQIQEAGRRAGRRVYGIPESDLNDPRMVLPAVRGGYGFEAQWSDDFHHALHTVLTGEQRGYYEDFGALEDLLRALRRGYVYGGQYSEHRQRSHGASSEGVRADQLVVFSQNHDQVGNRMLGERLSGLVPTEALKLAAAVVLLSPFLPLLFMGEEYGETAPFLYFVDHSDPRLIEAVRKGRREEFARFEWKAEPPDPQAESTFLRSKLNRELRREGRHRAIYDLYRELLRLRRADPALASLSWDRMEAGICEQGRTLYYRRWSGPHQVVAAFHFGRERSTVRVPAPEGRWRRLLAAGEGVPETLGCSGELALALAPAGFALFGCEG